MASIAAAAPWASTGPPTHWALFSRASSAAACSRRRNGAVRIEQPHSARGMITPAAMPRAVSIRRRRGAGRTSWTSDRARIHPPAALRWGCPIPSTASTVCGEMGAEAWTACLSSAVAIGAGSVQVGCAHRAAQVVCGSSSGATAISARLWVPPPSRRE